MISIVRNILDNSSFKSRMLKGSFWLGMGGSLEYGLRFLRNIVLARLLVPEDFGLMAIILAVNAALESFTQIGIKEAIIQSPNGEDDTYLNGAWWLSFFRSMGLFVIAMICLPYISSFYKVSQNTLMFRVSFLAILFNGALSAQAFVSQKKMDYKKWVVISSGGGIFGIIVTIGLSLWFQSVWALVIGYVVESAMRCMLSFVVCPFLPRLLFRKEQLQALFKFSRAMFGLPILYFIFTQSDIFVVGKLLSKNELGLYSMGLSLAQLPMHLVSTIINPLLMPMFSEKQNDKNWLNRNLIQSTKLIVLIGTPMIFFIALYSSDLLTIIYGQEYTAVALPFSILLGSALLRAAGTPIANIYLAVGQPELLRYFSGIRAFLILLMIYPAVKLFGLTGAASASFLAMLLAYVMQIVRIGNVTDLHPRKYGVIFLQGVLVSLLVLIVWFTAHNNASFGPLNDVILGSAICLAAYVLLGVIALRFKHIWSTKL